VRRGNDRRVPRGPIKRNSTPDPYAPRSR
jgi:hypothetical protein